MISFEAVSVWMSPFAWRMRPRTVTIAGRPFNQGFLRSASGDLLPLRRKFFLPDEPGYREARWFDRGDSDFAVYHADGWSFGLPDE